MRTFLRVAPGAMHIRTLRARSRRFSIHKVRGLSRSQLVVDTQISLKPDKCRVKIPTFDIELIVSGKAAKLLKQAPTERAGGEPVHFLARWRVEIAEDEQGHKLLLVTNAVTLFSLLIPVEAKMRFEQLAEHFVMRLRFELLGVTPPVEWKPGQVRAVRGGSASLIGSMNNMVYLLSRRSRPLHEEEDILNDTPFFAIPEAFPRKAFYGRLGEITPPSRALFSGAAVEDQDTPADQAQNLYYDAIEAPSEAEEFILLRKALQIDPENVDAMRAMLVYRGLSPGEELKELRRILTVAERRLGSATFKEWKGAFWGNMKTRPYMRVRAQLAERLQTLGQSDEAIAEWEGMLELNPNDNQGNRYPLLAELLARHQLVRAAEIFAKYNECEFSTPFAWCRVLERFLCDDREGAKQALIVARRQNGHAEAYIKGHKRLPAKTPEAYTVGSKEEAICFAEMLHNCWSKHPEALKWLNAQPRER